MVLNNFGLFDEVVGDNESIKKTQESRALLTTVSDWIPLNFQRLIKRLTVSFLRKVLR